MKVFSFVIEKDGKRKTYTTTSKHLNGAVRKLYQECEFDNVIRIL